MLSLPIKESALRKQETERSHESTIYNVDSFLREMGGLFTTGAIYVHLQYGPVPDHYDFFLANLVQEKALDAIEVIFDEEKRVAGEVFQALEEPDTSLFNEYEHECLKLVSSYFGGMSAKEISSYSHSEEGYKQTSSGQIISYEWAEPIQLPAK